MNPAHAVNQEACRFDGAAKGWRQSFIRTGVKDLQGKIRKTATSYRNASSA